MAGVTGLLPCNIRNGCATQFPQAMTAQSGLYQYAAGVKTNYHIKVVKRRISDGVIVQTKDLELDAGANTNGITPIYSTEDVNASHYYVALGVDDQERVWLFGNSLNDAPHCYRSAPGDLSAAWTSIVWPWTNFDPTTSCTYNILNRLSDGRLLYALSQRESQTAYPEGDRFYLMILPLGTNTWQPLVGTDGWFCKALSSPPAGQATRVYLSGIAVTSSPIVGRTDRVHVWGNFRIAALDATTQQGYWYVYNDNVTDSTGWKQADGTAQTMPLMWDNCGAPTSGACIPIVGTYSPFNSGYLGVDNQWHPHVLINEGGTNNQWHYWHNGTAWQNEKSSTSVSGCSVVPFQSGSSMLLIRIFATAMANQPAGYAQNRIGSIPIGGPVDFRMGSIIDNSGTNKYFTAYPDPILLRQTGVYSIPVFSGDNLQLHDFGKHRRFHP